MAVACGLHKIVSNVFKPSVIPMDLRADLIGIMRQRTYCIPAPKDAIELGERVWALYVFFSPYRTSY